MGYGKYIEIFVLVKSIVLPLHYICFDWLIGILVNLEYVTQKDMLYFNSAVQSWFFTEGMYTSYRSITLKT